MLAIPNIDQEKLDQCNLSVAEILAIASHLNGEDKIWMTRVRPKIVCLCGSTKFKDAFVKANRDETLEGNIVLSVGVFSHEENLDMDGDTKKMLDELHVRKIDMADEVLFLNVDGYIGQSTLRELKYCRVNEKDVRFLEEPNKENNGKVL